MEPLDGKIMGQLTTISFFRFTGLKGKMWAFGMMQFAHARMRHVEGMEFYKLMGTGKAQFNPFPDWSVYAILQTWSNEAAADRFFSSNGLFHHYQKMSKEHWVLYLRNRIARGHWDGSNPFIKSDTLTDQIPYVVALTRATIKTRFLLKFWRFVPKSQTELWGNNGLMYTKGVGEVPFQQMATFSVWKDEASLNAFAYQTQGHVKAIGKTRELGWYREELFARFQPYRSMGTWNGQNPIPGLTKQGIP